MSCPGTFSRRPVQGGEPGNLGRSRRGFRERNGRRKAARETGKQGQAPCRSPAPNRSPALPPGVVPTAALGANAATCPLHSAPGLDPIVRDGDCPTTYLKAADFAAGPVAADRLRGTFGPLTRRDDRRGSRQGEGRRAGAGAGRGRGYRNESPGTSRGAPVAGRPADAAGDRGGGRGGRRPLRLALRDIGVGGRRGLSGSRRARAAGAVGRPRDPGGLVVLAAGWNHFRWSDRAADDLTRVVSEEPRPVWLRGVLRDVPTFRPGADPGRSGFTRGVLEVVGIRGARGDWESRFGAGGAHRGGRPVRPVRRRPRRGGRWSCADRRAPEPRGIRLPHLPPGRRDHPSPRGRQPVRGLGGRDGGGRRDRSWTGTRLLGRARAWSHSRLVGGLDPATAPLAAALLLGRREGVDPEVNDAFARTGTTHLLAISGLHLQVLAAVALDACSGPSGCAAGGRFVAVIAATTAYALLVGLMPSVVRSAAMTLDVLLRRACSTARPARRTRWRPPRWRPSR